jgi:membrane-associated phospholipid phosphatase
MMSTRPPFSQLAKAGSALPAPRGATFWILFGLAAAVGVILAARADNVVQEFVLLPEASNWMGLARGISETAKGHWPIVAGIVMIIAGRYRRQIEWRRMGLLIILASALAGLSVMIVRGVVGRTRPSNKIEQGWFGPYHEGRWLVGCSAYNSFPSGHTGTATGLACALLLIRNRWRWLAVGWAGAVAWSRIALNYHHFSDVVGASVFGFVAAWVVVQWMNSEHFVSSWLARVSGLSMVPGPENPSLSSPPL